MNLMLIIQEMLYSRPPFSLIINLNVKKAQIMVCSNHNKFSSSVVPGIPLDADT